MAYERKTIDVWDVEGDYGQGFELVTCGTTRKEARGFLADYRKNEPGRAFRIVKKRERKDAETLRKD